MENINNISDEEAKANELEAINNEIDSIQSALSDPLENEDTLWWMLYYSLSNNDNMTEPKHNEKALFMYRMLTQLFKLIDRAYKLRHQK